MGTWTLVRQNTRTETAHPGQALICVNYFIAGGPSKEHGTDKPPPTVWKRYVSYHLPELFSLASTLAEQWVYY